MKTADSELDLPLSLSYLIIRWILETGKLVPALVDLEMTLVAPLDFLFCFSDLYAIS